MILIKKQGEAGYSQNKNGRFLYDITKLDISEIFSSLYNKSSEYLDSLTPDKIVCLFNIIIEGLIYLLSLVFYLLC